MIRFAWLCSHEVSQPEALLEEAFRAEQAGFDLILASDRFQPWVDDDAASGFVWAWLGAAAQVTSRVELATAVTCPIFRYHPAVVAQAAATLDRLSGGRFRLGLGTGDAINDASLGFHATYHERLERIHESLDIMQGLWSGKTLDYEGRYYRTERARLYTPPLGRVPVWMAASGPRSATIAGMRADGLVTSVRDPQHTLERVVEPFRAASTPDAVVVATRWCVLAEDDDEAWRALGAMRGLRVPGRDTASDPAELRARADDLGPRAVLDKFARASAVDDLVDVYRPLTDVLHADYVSIQVASTAPLETIDMIGSRVLPVLRAAE